MIPPITGQKHAWKTRSEAIRENSGIVQAHNFCHLRQYYVYRKLQLQIICKSICPRNVVCFAYIIANSMQCGDDR